MDETAKRQSKATSLLEVLEKALSLSEKVKSLAGQIEASLFSGEPLPPSKTAIEKETAAGVIGDTTKGLRIIVEHLDLAEGALNRIWRELVVG